MNLLVTGGAGYIGSHMTLYLLDLGHQVTVFDNLSHGYRDAVSGAKLVVGDLQDRGLLDTLFKANEFDGVMHFASFIEVAESIVNPQKYYGNNVSNTLNLLEAMNRHKVRRLIFSSSAAVYGEPEYVPIDEKHPKSPLNPYGRSKWMVEQFLHDFDRACQLRSISLRYFNAAGADPDCEIGEDHDPETHVIPVAIQVANQLRDAFGIYGDDYPTTDGTAVRDYVHVVDLVDAHLRALDRLDESLGAINLGTHDGLSVRQIVEAVERVSGRPLPVRIEPRRPGDPPALIADTTKAADVLGWAPQHSTVDEMVESAWCWFTRYPNGYASAPAVPTASAAT